MVNPKQDVAPPESPPPRRACTTSPSIATRLGSHRGRRGERLVGVVGPGCGGVSEAEGALAAESVLEKGVVRPADVHFIPTRKKTPVD